MVQLAFAAGQQFCEVTCIVKPLFAACKTFEPLLLLTAVSLWLQLNLLHCIHVLIACVVPDKTTLGQHTSSTWAAIMVIVIILRMPGSVGILLLVWVVVVDTGMVELLILYNIFLQVYIDGPAFSWQTANYALHDGFQQAHNSWHGWVSPLLWGSGPW